MAWVALQLLAFTNREENNEQLSLEFIRMGQLLRDSTIEGFYLPLKLFKKLNSSNRRIFMTLIPTLNVIRIPIYREVLVKVRYVLMFDISLLSNTFSYNNKVYLLSILHSILFSLKNFISHFNNGKIVFKRIYLFFAKNH